MPQCRKCSEIFPNRLTIDGERKSLNKRKFCLDCSPYKTHNTRDITKSRIPEFKVCNGCHQKLPAIAYYLRRQEAHTYLTSQCKKCFNNSGKGRISKTNMLAQLGGECTICGLQEPVFAYSSYGS